MSASAFITKWYVTDTIVLPLIDSGTYDFNVEWGDGSPTDHITVYDKGRHTYHSPGVYEITITGTIKGWRAKDRNEYQLLDVSQWGCLKLGNKGFYFEGCKRLQIS